MGGRAHVLARSRRRWLDLFHGLGYSVYQSPEVIRGYNFAGSNFPPESSGSRRARHVLDRSGAVLLRTHTLPGWVRAMSRGSHRSGLVFPGRVYRAEQSTPALDQFHQMDACRWAHVRHWPT